MQPVLLQAGIRAVVTTTAAFVPPPLGQSVSVQVDNAVAFIPGQPVYVRGHGVYRVVSRPNYRQIVIEPTENCQIPDGPPVPAGTVIVPGTLNTAQPPPCFEWALADPAAQPTITPSALLPATTTTAAFTQPGINSTAVVQVASTSGISVGMRLVILEGNVYEVMAVSGLSVTLKLLELTASGGVAPGASVPVGSAVCFATNAKALIVPNGGTLPDLSKYRVKTLDTIFTDPDNSKKHQNVSVCLGPGVMGDPNSGIYSQEWVLWSDFNDKKCYAAKTSDIPGTKVALASVYPEYTTTYDNFYAFCSFCFDQDGNVCMAWESSPTHSAVLTKFGGVVQFEGFSPVLVSNKDPRYYLDSTTQTDVNVYYLKGPNVPRCSRTSTSIYFRVQRDLFAVEYAMASGLPPLRGLDFVKFDSVPGALCGGYEYLRAKDTNCQSITLRSTRYQPTFGFSDNFNPVSAEAVGGGYTLVAVVETVPADTFSAVAGEPVSGAVFDVIVLETVPGDAFSPVSGTLIDGQVFDVIVLEIVPADTFSQVSGTALGGAYAQVLIPVAAADTFSQVGATVLGGSYVQP